MADVSLTFEGLTFHCSKAAAEEARVIWREIFALRDYCRHGVRIPARAVVVDVGANIGLFTLFALEQGGPGTRVLAIEAIPENARLLRKNLRAHPGVSCVRAALGSFANAGRRARFRFHPAIPANTSSVDWKLRQDDAWLGVEAFRVSKQIAVRLTTLSAVLSTHHFDRGAIDLLKIDTEGSELDVLEGLSDGHLARVEQVVAEANRPAQAVAIQSFLRARGFRVVIDLPRWAVSERVPNRTIFAKRRRRAKGAKRKK